MGKPRIIIVEDDRTIRTLLRATLPAIRAEIVEAQTGQEALQATQGWPPDLMLLDWHLPERSGAEVLEALKQSHPALRVIVVTADLDPPARARAQSLGVDAFLTKPFSPIELLRLIDHLLGVES